MASVLRAERIPKVDMNIVEVFVGALEYAFSENFSNVILDVFGDELSGVFSVEFEPLFWVCVNQMGMGSHVFFTGESFGHFASSLRPVATRIVRLTKSSIRKSEFIYDPA